MTRRDDHLAGLQAILVALGVPDTKIVHLGAEGSHGPRPDKPYMTIQILTHGTEQGPAEQVPGLNGSTPQITARNAYTGTVSFVGFGSGAYTWIRELQLSHDTPAILTLQETHGVSLTALGGMVDSSVVVDTAEEPRYSLDMSISYVDQGTSADEVELASVVVTEAFERYDGDGDPLTNTLTILTPQ